jgi:hypothetical protein
MAASTARLRKCRLQEPYCPLAMIVRNEGDELRSDVVSFTSVAFYLFKGMSNALAKGANSRHAGDVAFHQRLYPGWPFIDTAIKPGEAAGVNSTCA